MNKEKKTKKAIALLITLITVLLTPKLKAHDNKNETVYNDNYRNDSLCFAIYDNKNIYILNEDEIELVNESNENIIIIDQTSEKDPNFSIQNSYRIHKISEIKEIIKILSEYEKKFPSKWERSEETMEIEWLIHNLCHFFNINSSRAQTVDLNNNDEEKYNYAILKLILK